MNIKHVMVFCLLFILAFSVRAQSLCSNNDVRLQVLGSGGPEINDHRASTSYLVWINSKARILIDAGGGSSVNFEKSNAKFNNLQAVLFSHFHVDHSADFPVYIKGSFFTDRQQDLPVFGPQGNQLMPSTTAFIQRMFGIEGAYSYLQDYVNPEQSNNYFIHGYNVAIKPHTVVHFPLSNEIQLSAIPVHHGPLPALAWRIDIFDCSITFSGDMNNQYKTLASLAKETDILVMHNAIPESAQGVAANLHMKPSEIGKIAHNAGAKSVVISHRMLRTLGKDVQTKKLIEKNYHGPIKFANDMDIFTIP